METNKEKEESVYTENVGGGKSTGSNPQPEKRDYTKAIVILIITIAVVSAILTLS